MSNTCNMCPALDPNVLPQGKSLHNKAIMSVNNMGLFFCRFSWVTSQGGPFSFSTREIMVLWNIELKWPSLSSTLQWVCWRRIHTTNYHKECNDYGIYSHVITFRARNFIRFYHFPILVVTRMTGTANTWTAFPAVVSSLHPNLMYTRANRKVAAC